MSERWFAALRKGSLAPTRAEAARWALLAAVLVLFVAVGAWLLPPAVDWRHVLRPGSLALLSGQSPYTAVERFSAPPWGALLLAPLAVLPEAVGRALLVLISLAAFAYSAHRLGAGLVALVAFLLSPPVLHCLLNGNLDWLVLLGAVLPPAWGLLLISIKPQVGFAVGLFWCVEAWRAGGWRAAARLLAPVSLAFLASFALFGLWPLGFFEIAEYSQSWNASLWPLSIPVGLALLVAALRARRLHYALPASPCLSPYVLFHSWSVALAAVLSDQTLTLAAVLGLWIATLLRL